MSYAIEITGKTGSVAEIRRIAAERIASARKGLRKISKDRDEWVHEIRKDLKKLRALIRLVRDALGKSCYKREDRAFRNAGRALAPFRDAGIRLALVKTLREKNGDGMSAAALRIADEKVRSLYEKTVRKRKVRKAVKKADRWLEEAEARVKEWPLEERTGFCLFREGLKRSYSRGVTSLARCLIHPTDAHFHDWRKCCKYLRYQIDLLHLASPEKLKEMENALHGLTDVLGDDHDLAVLGETLEPLAGEALSYGELRAIHDVLEAEHRRLMEDAWPRGQRLFAETPDDFVNRIEGYWRDFGRRVIQ